MKWQQGGSCYLTSCIKIQGSHEDSISLSIKETFAPWSNIYRPTIGLLCWDQAASSSVCSKRLRWWSVKYWRRLLFIFTPPRNSPYPSLDAHRTFFPVCSSPFVPNASILSIFLYLVSIRSLCLTNIAWSCNHNSGSQFPSFISSSKVLKFTSYKKDFWTRLN